MHSNLFHSSWSDNTRLAWGAKLSLLSAAFTLSCLSMWKSKVKEVTSILCSSLFTLFYLSLTHNRLPLGELWTHFDSLTGTFQAFGLCVCVLKPLRIFRQHGDCHPEVRQFYGLVSTALCCDDWAAPAGFSQFAAQPVLRCAGISQFSGLMSVLHNSGNPDLMLLWPRPYRLALIHLYGHRTVILRSKGILRVEIERLLFSHFTGIHGLWRILCDISLWTNGNFNMEHVGFPRSWKSWKLQGIWI